MKHIFDLIVNSSLLPFRSGTAARVMILLAVTACFGGPVFLSDQRSVVGEQAGFEKANNLSESDESPTALEEALKWIRLGWVDEKGEIPQDALTTGKQQRDANIAQNFNLPSSAGIAPASWVSKGPQNVGGRTKALVIDPTNPSMMWAAAASGGIWFTSNGGANWSPVNDFLPTLNSNSLAMKPGNPNEIYCGTGEPFFQIGTSLDDLPGAGIFKTTNATAGGGTWIQLPSTASWGTVAKVAISPNGNVILATTAAGIQRSTNGGANWVTTYPNGPLEVVFHPTDSNMAVAGIGGGCLYSTNAGVSWTSATISSVSSSADIVRLAYAPNTPSIVYASAVDSSDSRRKIWRSTDGGRTYGQPVTATGQNIATQGAYTHAIWVCPSNPNLILEGGVFLHRSTDGGVTFSQITDHDFMSNNVHADLQFVVSETNDPQSFSANPRVYACTDGGIYRTDNIFTAGIFSWVSRNQTYQTSQFYSAAGNTNYVLGGTQDNGTLRVTLANPNASLTFGGDGGFCAIDPSNDLYSYGEYVFLRIHRSTNHGVSSDYIYDGIADAANGNTAGFIAPFILDPNDPNRMYAGGLSLWRSSNVRDPGVSWSVARSPQSFDTFTTAIAVAPGNSNVIWVGQVGGRVYRTTDAGNIWTVIDDNTSASPLPDRFVTRIFIDPADAAKVYITFGGFKENNLYRTNNGLAPAPTWTDITGGTGIGLPKVPVRGITRNPTNANWLYAGTEVGIFTSENGGATWATSNQGPAGAPVFELSFLHNTTILLAATFGRGLWTAETVPPLPGSTNLALNKPATQSTTAYGGTADRGVDGNASGIFDDGHMTHTGIEVQPWWQVDLGCVSQSIQTIRIYNRTECCWDRLDNSWLFVSDVPFVSNNLNDIKNQAGVFSYHITAVGSSITIPVGRGGRFVRVQLDGAGQVQFSLAEVEVIGIPCSAQATNLALNKLATQSTTGYGGTADRGVDGNASGVFDAGHMTHTGIEVQPWWQVDLGCLSQSIQTIKIYNRTECCWDRLDNSWVFVSDVPFVSNNLNDIKNQPGVFSYHITAVGSSITIPADRSGRFVRVQLDGAGQVQFSLAEVEVIGIPCSAQATNLALNKLATQSTTGYGGTADRGVDGNASGVFDAGHMTHTGIEVQPWWQVDLGGISQSIQTIKIYNRTECCWDRLDNSWVFVSDVPFVSNNLNDIKNQPGVFSYHITTVGSSITIPVGRSGRFVRVQLDGAGQGQFSLAEVEVWGY